MTGAGRVEELLRRGADHNSVTLDVGAAEVAAVTDTDLVAPEWGQSDGIFDLTRFLASRGQSSWGVATGTPVPPVVANYVTKPLDLHQFLEVVDAAIHRGPSTVEP